MTGLGIGLLLAGVVLLVAEAHITAGGALGALGVAAVVGGTVLAVDGAGGGIALTLVLALIVGVVAGGALFLGARAVGRSARRLGRGRDALIGASGRAREPLDADGGRVLVEGALWRARNAYPEEPVAAGDPVVVERIDGLTLTVRRAEPWELHP
jgi:membrane-bound serine protease (ClpP class)